MKAVVFDFDGPIFDGRSAAQQALQSAWEDLVSDPKWSKKLSSSPVSLEGTPLYGPDELIRVITASWELSAQEISKVKNLYLKYLTEIEFSMSPRKTVRDVLDQAVEAGLKLGVLSNRKSDGLKKLLSHLGIARLFQAIVGREDNHLIKPNPKVLERVASALDSKPTDIILIGDSDNDWRSARLNGAIYYHAAYTGEPSYSALKAADAIISSEEELHHIFRCVLDEPISAPRWDTSSPLPEPLLKAIEDKNLVVFAGAGISVPSGVGGWEDFYRPILEKLGASLLGREYELPEALELAAESQSQRLRIFDEFKNSFTKQFNKEPNAYHNTILRTLARHVWTTNYDRLFETANQSLGSLFTSIYDDEGLFQNVESPYLLIKMHGDFHHTGRRDDSRDWGVVLLQEDFDVFEIHRGEIWRLLEDDFRNRCIIFVGVSYRDPVLRRLLSVARRRAKRTRYPHYFLMRRGSHPVERKLQKWQIERLERQRIEVVGGDSFGNIEKFIKRVALAAQAPIIGFSGSMPTGDEQFRLPDGQLTAREVQEICQRVALALVRKGFRITSGCGPFVGEAAVEAAFQADPRCARNYLRKGGGSHFKRTAPAIVVAEASYDAMRATFVPELSLLIAIAGRGGGGTGSEIRAAMERGIPVILITQAGGEVKRFVEEEFDTLMLRSYAYSQELSEMIRSLNLDVRNCSPGDLRTFVDNGLIRRIEELMHTLMGSPFQSGANRSKFVRLERSW